MNQKDAMKKFEKDLEKALSDVFFPKDRIYQGFNSLVLIALETKSALTLSVDATPYKRMINEADPVTVSTGWDLYAISYALNAVNGSSPNELRLTLSQYAEVMQENQKMMDLWHELVEPIKKFVMDNNAQKQQAGPRLVPSTNGKRNGKRK